MRLLNVYTLKLEEFFGDLIPPYYILSHRWGEGEVSYKDYVKGHITDGPGYQKINQFCEFVRRRNSDIERSKDVKDRLPGVVYLVWIDTCCIDKRSSAELSEAINSMYTWYLHSRECIVYLADVTSNASWFESESIREGELSKSSWFRRGWTLQELIAPSTVTFCDSNWRVIGHICPESSWKMCLHGAPHGVSLLSSVSQITAIPRPALNLDFIFSPSLKR